MKRPVLLIVANIVILMAVFGSFARSQFSATPAHDNGGTTSLSHSVYPDATTPTLHVAVAPGEAAGTVLVKGHTEAVNSVTINGVPVVVQSDGSFSAPVSQSESSCVITATTPEGVSSQVVKPLAQAASLQSVPYGTPYSTQPYSTQ